MKGMPIPKSEKEQTTSHFGDVKATKLVALPELLLKAPVWLFVMNTTIHPTPLRPSLNKQLLL